ncbi:hypothetical protein HZS_1422 [Henneguya salminicola]|nr:hypothetical protein HZS_1422 [Henneguya salminicola]
MKMIEILIILVCLNNNFKNIMTFRLELVSESSYFILNTKRIPCNTQSINNCYFLKETDSYSSKERLKKYNTYIYLKKIFKTVIQHSAVILVRMEVNNFPYFKYKI